MTRCLWGQEYHLKFLPAVLNTESQFNSAVMQQHKAPQVQLLKKLQPSPSFAFNTS